MPDLPRTTSVTGARTIQCADCGTQLAVDAPGARIKHHPDGSHTFIPPTPPRAVTDPKPRGRRRA